MWIKHSILIILALCLILLSACTATSQASPTPSTYWEGSGDLIETNDVARLQKEIPFTIILPEYLPDKLESYRFWMRYHKLGQDIVLAIHYDSLKEARKILIAEGPPQDGHPRPLSPGALAQIYPKYTPIELDGIEVLEKNGYDTVIRDTKSIDVSAFYYILEPSDLKISGVVSGYTQPEARKIIESMIK